MTYAHQWLIHRDVKPANILPGRDRRVALTDFGVAKDLVSGATGSTIAGTGRYMAPEQRQGAPVDGRADVFALGLVLAEMLLGEHPWEALLTAQPEAVSSSAVALPDLPAPSVVADRLRAAVDRATQPAPAARYASMAAFVSDLEAIAALAPRQQAAVAPAAPRRWWSVRPPRWAAALGGAAALAALAWSLRSIRRSVGTTTSGSRPGGDNDDSPPGGSYGAANSCSHRHAGPYRYASPHDDTGSYTNAGSYGNRFPHHRAGGLSGPGAMPTTATILRRRRRHRRCSAPISPIPTGSTGIEMALPVQTGRHPRT